ncbi:ankyrin repeat-containing domain protein [Tribonema minus]|uniref:Ankyrin repeat-containing domain protein n=1 Tax=Tribonema minus TaxID=303371 RepID=A0A836CK47_9STRA|nr:ankyrin repeat-containing domain protein [Tribonema minus]
MSNIWIAAGDGNLERVQHLVEQGQSVNAADDMGYTPMHAAASYGHADVMTWLLARGADVNIRDSDGDTPLHHCDTAAAARFLLERGADAAAVNAEGMTPAMVAADDDNEELCALYGVAPQPQDENTLPLGTHAEGGSDDDEAENDPP